MGYGTNWEDPHFWDIRHDHLEPLIHRHEGGILHLMKIWETIKGVPFPGPPPGVVVPVLSMGLVKVGGNSALLSPQYPLTRIDISQYNTLHLLVRLHNVDWATSSGDYIKLAVYNDAYTPEDPNTSFISDTELASVTFTENVETAPAAKTASLDISTSSSVGSMVAVGISVSTSSGYNAMVSSEIILRR